MHALLFLQYYKKYLKPPFQDRTPPPQKSSDSIALKIHFWFILGNKFYLPFPVWKVFQFAVEKWPAQVVISQQVFDISKNRATWIVFFQKKEKNYKEPKVIFQKRMNCIILSEAAKACLSSGALNERTPELVFSRNLLVLEKTSNMFFQRTLDFAADCNKQFIAKQFLYLLFRLW